MPFLDDIVYHTDGGRGGGIGTRGGGGSSGGGGGAKPDQPPAAPTASDIAGTAAETGHCIPIVHGTVKKGVEVLERYNYKIANGGTQQWAPSHGYGIGDLVWSNGNTYVCTTAGTSTTGTVGQGLSGTGSGIADGSAVWSYAAQGYRHMLALGICEGQITGVGKAWVDKTNFAAYTSIPHEAFWIEMDLGAVGGLTRPNWFPATSPATPYGNTAVLLIDVTNASDSDIPSIALEVGGIGTAAVGDDVNPADIAIDLLTHARRGIAWPAARVDNVSTGSGAASWRTYCTANGLKFSWLIDSQTDAMQLLTQLLAATNTDPVMTNRPDGLGWMIKFVPRGDQALTANGVTYTPDTTPLYNLSQDDFLEPLQIRCVSGTQMYNWFDVEYVDRANGYTRLPVADPDQSDIDLRGLQRAPVTRLPFVMSPDAAIMLSRIYAQRSLNVTNTYTVTVGWRYFLVEPGDILTLSDSVMGLTNQPVKVIATEEDQASEQIVLTVEDYPAAVSAAAKYSPQVGDGFKPSVPTGVTGLVLLPGQVPPGGLPLSSTTLGNADNVWLANPTSENPPPDGADTSRPEWAGRTSSASAYAGNWVRQLTAALNGNQQLGDTVSTSIIGVTYQSQLGFHIPCAPGDQFYIEAQTRWITATGAEQCGVYLYFLDASGAKIGTASANAVNSGGVGPWTKSTAIGTAPSGAVTARLILFMNAQNGAATAQFDAIYARRVIDPVVLGKLGGNVIDEIQDAAMKALGRLTTGSSSTVPPTISVQEVWYRGNNDNGTLTGAPNIFCLTVFPVLWNTTLQHCRYSLRLQPTAANDNLDAMRYAEITLYKQSAAGTSGTLTQVAFVRTTLVDRLYKVPGTDSDTGNLAWVTDSITDPGINGGVPAMLITIYNVNGPSDTHCFYAAAGWTAGTALTDNGQNWPAGLLGGTAGSGGGGGGGGGNCLDPETPVLIAPGKLAPLRTIREGDLLWTRPEAGGDLGFHRVTHASIERNLRCRVTFADGRHFTSSINHLLNVRGLWRRADSLLVGEEVQGDPGGHVASVEYLGEGPVVKLTLPTAGTYFAGDGVWHHNVFKP